MYCREDLVLCRLRAAIFDPVFLMSQTLTSSILLNDPLDVQVSYLQDLSTGSYDALQKHTSQC